MNPGATISPAASICCAAGPTVSATAETRPPSVPYDEAPTPEPEPQENMPDAATAPASPATNVPASIDLDAITVPTAP